MIGGPSLLLCHEGPISKIFCPNFTRRSIGMKIRSNTAQTKTAATPLSTEYNTSVSPF